jgi:hypothetical protein
MKSDDRLQNVAMKVQIVEERKKSKESRWMNSTNASDIGYDIQTL